MRQYIGEHREIVEMSDTKKELLKKVESVSGNIGSHRTIWESILTYFFSALLKLWCFLGYIKIFGHCELTQCAFYLGYWYARYNKVRIFLKDTSTVSLHLMLLLGSWKLWLQLKQRIQFLFFIHVMTTTTKSQAKWCYSRTCCVSFLLK